MRHTGESHATLGTASDVVIRPRSAKRRAKVSSMALVGVIMASVVGVQIPGQAGAAASRQAASAPARNPYGWSSPYSGTPRYEKYAPRELTHQRQLNQPIGRVAADRIARGLGLDKSKTFTEEQYIKFVTGQGAPFVDPNDCPTLVDESVRILTNTVGNPLYYKVDDHLRIATVLASYGLMVNEEGLLQSPANLAAPTRQVNICLVPRIGYLDRWAQSNGASASITMLRNSAYTSEAVYGNRSQAASGVAQLVTNQKGSRSSVLGMSIPPALWNVNFCLIYTLNPKLAANMPARWAPIPAPVADAIASSEYGQVEFSEYASYFEGSWYPVR